MNNSFRLSSDGIYRCDAFQEFVWQEHGFGTREANPPVDVTLRQIHSNRVLNASGAKDREREGDGLVTDELNKSIGIRTADCVPILMLDCRQRAVAAVHAGWRGTATEIVKHAVDKMREDFDSEPKDLYAAMGPCIRGCCYQIGTEVAEQFKRLFPEWEPVSGARTLNLPEANRRQLKAAGVPDEHIFDSTLCTTCQSAQFFSYRREPANPGRMVASICRLS